MPTSEDFLKVSIILILWEMWTGFWVPDRKVWKAPLNNLMALQVVEAAVKYMASGARIINIFDKKKISVIL